MRVCRSRDQKGREGEEGFLLFFLIVTVSVLDVGSEDGDFFGSRRT